MLLTQISPKTQTIFVMMIKITSNYLLALWNTLYMHIKNDHNH